jgi:hypothetical protein
VGANRNDGTLRLQVFNGWHGGTDASIIRDSFSVERNIHITADKNLFSLKVSLSEILNGFLGIELKVESGRTNTGNTEGTCVLK